MKTNLTKLNQILPLLAALLVLLGAATKVQATAYTFTNSSGSWNVAANWSPNGIPGTLAADTATITNSSKSVTTMGGLSPIITTLTINGTGSVTVDAGTLTLSGSSAGLIVGSSGAANLTIASGATVAITGTGNNVFTYGGTSSSVTNNGTFNLSGGYNAGGTTPIFANNGTTTCTGGNAPFNPSGITVIQGANAILNLNTTVSTPIGGTLTATVSGNTVSYGGTSPNIKGTTYYNLTIATSGNPGSGGALTVNGTLTIATTTAATLNIGALTLGNSATIIRTLGTLNVTPTFPGSPNYVNVIYNNTTAMTTGKELPANVANLTLTNTTSSANKVTLNSSATVNGTLAVTYLTTPTTSSGATVLTAASGKTLTFSSSPVTINLPGSTITGAGSPYAVVSGGSTYVSGTLGTITVQGAGVPASSSVVINGGQLLLGVGPTIYGAATTTAFTTTYGAASTAQSFAVSGVNLTSDVIATAGTGFEVATSSGGTYGASVTFTQTSGSASGTVFVRLAVTASASTSLYNSVNAVVLSSTSANNANITTPASGNTVNKRALTFTGSKTYDGSASATAAQLAFGNNVDGANLTMSGSVTLPAAGAGSRTISSFGGLTLGGSAAGNYTLTGASGSVTVGVRVLTFTGSKTYDASASATAAQLAFGNNVDGANLTMSGSVTLAAADAGSQSINSFGGLTLGGSAAGNYTLTGASGSVTISPASASVTADAQTKTYGDVNPTLTAVTNGAVNGDVINVTLTTDATQFSDVGVSNITVTAGSNPNYSVLTTNSTLTISARPITVTAQPNTKDYDGNTSATNMPTLTSGTLAGSDGFATLSEVYADATVGTGKTLIPSATVTNSASADVTADYAITFVNDTTGVINSGCTVPTIVGGIDGQTNLCAGSPLMLTLTNVTGTAPLFYQWQTNSVDIAGATNSSYTNLTVTVADAGDYVCVVSNACGSASSDVTVTVNPLPTVSVNSVTNCGTVSTVLTATTSASSPIYLWSDSETTASITVSPTSTTTYTVTVTDGVTGCDNSGSGTVTVNTVTANDVTYNETIGFSFKVAETNLLTHASGSGGVTLTAVQSPSANGVTVMNSGGQIFYLANVTNTDTFTYTVASVAGGCTATGTVTLNPIHPVGTAKIGIPNNGVVTIKFFGIPGTNYVVETATNVLFTPFWPLSTNTAGSDGSWQFTDPNATNQQQYYRSTWQP